jgi:hypothetical protein
LGQPTWGSPRLTRALAEIRSWESVLAPIYLQLLEALLRVSDGQSGAAFCRECGQPFLTLDARRSAFCNDRERFRFTQRERRKRLKTITIVENPDDERLDASVEALDRVQPPGAEAPE